MTLPANKTTFAQMSTLLCALFLVGAGFAQPDTLWTRVDPDGAGGNPCFICTTDGGYAIAGSSSPEPERRDSDFWLSKNDSLGFREWIKFFGGEVDSQFRSDDAHGLDQMPDNGFVVVGRVGQGGAMAVRTDSNGNIVWRKFYPLQEAPIGTPHACLVDDDGNIIVAGQGVAKISDAEEGEIIWHLDINDFQNWGLTKCSGGGFLVLGNANGDYYVVKMTGEGDVVWERNFGTDEFGEGTEDAVETLEGEFCLEGGARFGVLDSIYVSMARISSEGDVIWQRVFNQVHQGDRTNSIIATPDGGFAAAGYAVDGGVLYRVYSEGELIYRGTYGQRLRDECHKLMLMEDNGYVLGTEGGRGAKLIRTLPDTTIHVNTALLDPAFPSQFAFSAPYPNPFNSTLSINYEIPSAGPMTLRLFDVSGSHVETLVNEFQPTGSHSIIWNANGCPAGLYFLRLESGILSAT